MHACRFRSAKIGCLAPFADSQAEAAASAAGTRHKADSLQARDNYSTTSLFKQHMFHTNLKTRASRMCFTYGSCNKSNVSDQQQGLFSFAKRLF